MMFTTQVAQRVIVRGPNGEIVITVLNGRPRIEFRTNPQSVNPDAVISWNPFGNDTLVFETNLMRSEYASSSNPQPLWYVRSQGGIGIMLDNNTDTLRRTNGSILTTAPEVWTAIPAGNFVNGWTPHPTDPPANYLDASGFVHYRGRAVPGVTVDGTTMFTIFDVPARNYFVPCMQDNAPYVRPGVEVQSGGAVRIFNWSAGNVVLDAVTYCTFLT